MNADHKPRMTADHKPRTTTLLALLAVLAISLAGCGASKAYKRGLNAEYSKNFDTAMAEYKIALDKDPENIEYQLKYEQARFNAALSHFEAGRRAVDKAEYQTAKAEFTRTLEIDPTHVLAQQQLDKVNDLLSARTRGAVEPEIQFDDLRQSTRTDPSVQAQLEPRIRGPIDTININQDSRVAFESLAEMAGLNVIFDPDFRGTRIPIELRNVDIFEALDIVALQTRSFWKPVNKTTILVSPDNQTKRRDY